MSILTQLLDRPVVERKKENRYRLGQSLVFGLPVVALQIWGPKLGGSESARWVAVMQALLSGWILNVAAVGMLVEGILQLVRRRLTGGLAASLAAIGMYIYSCVSMIYVPFTGRPGFEPLLFHWSVVVMIAWSGCGWLVLRWRTK